MTNLKKTRRVGALSIFTLAAGVAVAPQSAFATSVIPETIDNNPSCNELGYPLFLKVEPPSTGTYPLPDGINTVTITTADGVYFNWSSTLSMDVVISKGGTPGNVYKYDPESTGDTGLESPVNSSGKPAEISHIEFCYDYELKAAKTANATWYKTIDWTITKESDGSYTGFVGDNSIHNYTVAVTKNETFGPYLVDGTITVSNPTPYTVDFGVSDVVDGSAAAVKCDTYSLAPGGSVTCPYNAALSSNQNGTNTATITSNTAGVGGTTASVPYTFGAAVLKEGSEPESISVKDSNDKSETHEWTTSVSANWPYTRDFTCPTSGYDSTGKYTDRVINIAKINETADQDSATVDLTCYAPVVSKTANTSLKRKWIWEIDKTTAVQYPETTPLLIGGITGISPPVQYSIDVKSSSQDSDWAAAGTITVQNPHPDKPMTVGLVDALNDNSGTVILDCGGSLTIPAAQSAPCGYTITGIADGTARTNKATATLGGGSFTTDLVSVDFTKATIAEETDKCVSLSDNKYSGVSLPAEVCTNTLASPYVYTRTFGPYNDVALCNTTFKEENTAFVKKADDSDTVLDESTATVWVKLACGGGDDGGGCTYTQGYWKTHAYGINPEIFNGPAPADKGWVTDDPDPEVVDTPTGSNTAFFSYKLPDPQNPAQLNPVSWYQVFWTAPQGNVYFNLAHQYMAAKLNILNGASKIQAVTDAIYSAEDLFIKAGTSASISKTDRPKAISAAATLGTYNVGGPDSVAQGNPPHCSE